jgi:membrane protease subunit HflC
MKKYILSPLVICVAIAFVRLTFYTVDAAEYAYVTVLGKHDATYDGSADAGLKFAMPWPIRQVLRLDRRLQQFDLPPTDQLTHDPKGSTVDKLLSIEAYVCWKIKDRDGADQFVQRIGSADRARKILEPLILSKLGAEIGEIRMDDLISTDELANGKKRVDDTLKSIHERLLTSLRPDVEREYGIELVDIRLRRLNHPASVRESIFARIRSERNKEAKKHLSDGDRIASDITSKADQAIRETLANARAEEEKIKADADTEANRIRNEAYRMDPDFYAFLKKMEKMQSIVGDSKAVLLLSTHRAMFDSLFTPPKANAPAPKKGDK